MTILTNARRALLLVGLATTTIAATAADKASGSPDLFSFAQGGRIVDAPEFPPISAMHASPLNLIDDAPGTDWEGENGEAVFVIELAEVTELHRISFDIGPLNRDAKSAKEFVVEVSETSPTKGFTEVLSGTLKMVKRDQSFTFKPEERPTAQWVRLTILSNYGDDYTALNGFRGYGKQLTQDANMPDLTGKYTGASGLGRFNIVDGDDGVTGCYEFSQGAFEGVVEGRVLKLDIVHRSDDTRLNGLFQLMPDGMLMGIVRNEGSAHRDAYASYYSAEKDSGKPNSC